MTKTRRELNDRIKAVVMSLVRSRNDMLLEHMVLLKGMILQGTQDGIIPRDTAETFVYYKIFALIARLAPMLHDEREEAVANFLLRELVRFEIIEQVASTT